jgi:hypothetical protein
MKRAVDVIPPIDEPLEIVVQDGEVVIMGANGFCGSLTRT